MSRGRHDGDGARGIVPGRHHDGPRDGTTPPTHAADPRRRSTPPIHRAGGTTDHPTEGFFERPSRRSVDRHRPAGFFDREIAGK